MREIFINESTGERWELDPEVTQLNVSNCWIRKLPTPDKTNSELAEGPKKSFIGGFYGDATFKILNIVDSKIAKALKGK